MNASDIGAVSMEKVDSKHPAHKLMKDTKGLVRKKAKRKGAPVEQPPIQNENYDSPAVLGRGARFNRIAGD